MAADDPRAHRGLTLAQPSRRGAVAAQRENRAQHGLQAGRVACSNVKQKLLTIGIKHVRPQKANMRLLVLTCITCVSLSACDSRSPGSASSAPSGSTVSIVEMTPSTGSLLSAGAAVSLKVKVAYTLTSDSGTLGLVVQDSNNVPLAQTMSVVLKGSATEEMNVSFTVPDTKAVQVFTPLSAQGQTATSTVSSRAYKVVAK